MASLILDSYFVGTFSYRTPKNQNIDMHPNEDTVINEITKYKLQKITRLNLP